MLILSYEIRSCGKLVKIGCSFLRLDEEPVQNFSLIRWLWTKKLNRKALKGVWISAIKLKKGVEKKEIQT